jgi:large-conductance mechanosensitive channel
MCKQIIMIKNTDKKILNLGSAQLVEFLDFMKKFGIIGLAIATIVGGQVTTLTKSLTENIIAPLMTLIANSILSIIKIDIASLKLFDLNIGKFISDLGMFALMMFLIYTGIKYFVAHFLTEDEKKALKM